MHAGKAHDFAPRDLQFRQGVGQTDRLGQPVFGQTARLVGADVGVQYIGAGLRDRRGTVATLPPLEEREVVVIFGRVRNQSSPS
jgi:hypothetical protein